MKDINEMRWLKAILVKEARDYLDECTKEDRQMTEEETKTYEEKLAAIRSKNEAIKREEELQAEEMSNPNNSDDEFRKAPKVKVVSNPEDRLLADPQGGFPRMGLFFRDIIRAGSPGGYESEALARWQGFVRTAGYMEEGDLAQGGYTVPVEYSKKIIEKSLETSIVRTRVPAENIMELAGNRLEVPADVDSDHSSNYFGGINIYRTGEGAQSTAKNPTFDMIALTLNHLNGLVYVTNDLLSDSIISMENYLRRKFGAAISFVEDDDFLNGSGNNMALGCFHSNNSAIVTQDAESNQGVNTVIAENIFKMWFRMYPAGHNRCIWVANPEVGPQLTQMNLDVGTGGIPVYMPAGGLSGSPYESLMGRPLLYSEKMQALGTAGDIGLVDLSQYYIGQKTSGLQFSSSMHIRFDYDETAFKFVMRYDGQPTWTSALTPKRGSKTLSPFVVLSSTRT